MGLLDLPGVHIARDQLGNPVPGAKRYIYLAGTDNYAALYSDSALKNSAGNPSEAGPDGSFAPCYLVEGSYSLKITSPSGEDLTATHDVYVKPNKATGTIRDFITVTDLRDDTSLHYTPASGSHLALPGSVVRVENPEVLFEIVAADALDYHQETANGVRLKVLPNALNEVCAEAFGAGLPGNDNATNATALQAAIDFASARQGGVVLGRGVRYSSPLIFRTNTRLRAAVPGFVTRLIPVDCPAFIVDGANAIGGFAFQIQIDDLLFDLSEVTTPQPYAALFKDCYRSHMRRMRFHSGALQDGVRFSSLIRTEGTCYHLIFDDVVAYGQGNTGSGRVFNLSHDSGSVTLRDPDAENCFTAFYFGPNATVDIGSPFLERFGVGFEFASSGDASKPQAVHIEGGLAKIPSSTSRVLLFDGGVYDKGEIISIDGLEWESSDPQGNAQVVSLGSFNWANKHPISLSNLNWQGVAPPPEKFSAAAAFWPIDPSADAGRYQSVFKLDDLADDVATDFLRLRNFQTQTPFAPVTVRIKAFASFNGYGRALDHAEWVLQHRAGSPVFVSAKQSISAVREHNASNFSIASFDLTATAGPTEATFAIRSNFNSAIQSTIKEVWFDVEIVGQVEVTRL